MLNFETTEKEAAFDLITSYFFEQNFGTFGKTDFELLMFHIYIQHLKKNDSPIDDYSISKTLGITQQRVRNLKIKRQLRYGQTADWKVELANTALKHPHYSEDDHFITLSFDDPTIMIEVQHFIEENGGFVDFSFNPKLLKMKTCDFACLMVEIGMSKNDKEAWKCIRTIYRAEKGGDEEITKDTLLTTVKKGGITLGKMVIETIVSCIISGQMASLK